MCGLFGYFAPNGGRVPRDLLAEMGELLRHRGPDDGASFVDHGIGLGSRRLSIVDLESGQMPLASESGDLHLVVNGEIYNARDLRARLSSRHSFATGSDAEPLLHLYEDEGLGFLRDVRGMYALALWDAPERRLLLARDRAGEKPLYFAWSEGVFYFASELRTFAAIPGLVRTLDRTALRAFLALGYLPGDASPFREIRRLAPGSIAIVDAGGDRERVETYWSLRPSAIQGARRFDADRGIDAAAEELHDCMRSAVGAQVEAEVPVGIALSGGLDSGWIAALARDAQPGALRTFTVRFADRSYDESDRATRLARHLGAKHHIVHVEDRDLVSAIEALAVHMDEPIADPAMIPTLLLARAARSEVKVLLSGEGADELLGGYPTYTGHLFADRYCRSPNWLRRGVVEPLIRMIPVSDKRVPLAFLLRRFIDHAGRTSLARHLAWFGVMDTEASARLAGPALEGAAEPDPAYAYFDSLLLPTPDWEGNRLASLLYADFHSYLTNALLVKVDRASMAASLESRAPFLDVDVMERCASWPMEWKVRGWETKRVLRKAAARSLPAWHISGRKRGFSVPLAALFRSAFRDRLWQELDPLRLRQEGILDGGEVARMLREHDERRANHARPLWMLWSLVQWYRHHAVPDRSRSPSWAVQELEPLASRRV